MGREIEGSSFLQRKWTFSYFGHVSTDLKFILLYFSEIIFHLAVNRVRTIVKPRSAVAFSPLAARPSVCPCNSSCRKKMPVYVLLLCETRVYVCTGCTLCKHPQREIIAILLSGASIVTVPTVPLSSMM